MGGKCCDQFNGASFLRGGLQVCRYCQTPIPAAVLNAAPVFDTSRKDSAQPVPDARDHVEVAHGGHGS
jgi:hypothetical protein